jgi:outer membrane autotransporter protein
MNFSKLNLDSDGAFTVANKEAVRGRVGFDTVDYVLQMDEETDSPTWALRLLTSDGRTAGTLFVAADSGRVTRTTGMGAAGGSDASHVEPRPQPRSGEPALEPRDADNTSGGGAAGHLERFRDRMKRHMIRDGAAMQEFFTGRRTIDREYRDPAESRGYDDTVPSPNY